MTYLMIYVLSCLLIHASAIPLKPRDVADPPITSPDANTVWTAGENVTVTWNTSSIPSSVTNSQGKVVLGYLTSDSENLNINSPLASEFPITAGQVSFVVPSVPTGNNYIVALFGDSGNISPEFTIIGTSSSSSPSAASSAASSSGLLALPSNSSSVSTPTDTESDSVTVVVTTEIVTSVAVVTVPGSTHYISSTGAGDPPSSSAPAQPTSTSEPVQSTATVISASDATSTADPPSSTDTPQTGSGSNSDPASSSTVTTTTAAATSSTSTSDAWSWRESAGKQPVSAALVVAAIFML
ncbi:uncharacterized protein LAESUDRAFT_723106 [Laetiporus sulphureus 93-53]|uniref:Yeast cell wall synthesis Kre9/Knh1-like N-terminal domain-containing protein n=1 Tax=Laetiporus sulphureus 93-53 TaxID=1314785 RepID=A0A165FSP0_9APHY|nr:uncharacterized protein LAESUDRAFT_723106 [Laetiporus sulphureus 93-53]KZT09363.1 hypothetical protein LAESUDRAFT_723106 [Laetiporus sulphureus 93-53]